MNKFTRFVNSKKLFFTILIVLFLGLVIINNTLFHNVRIDLTENNLYTLSPGTLQLVGKIKQPIDLYLFFSEEAATDYPQIKSYHSRVKEMLEEYQLYSNKKIRLHIINPEPFSEEEDRATQLGIQAVQVKGGTLYFGIAVANSIDDIEVIPFLQMEKEVLLEYDLSQLIYSVMRLKKPVLGLMTTLNMYPTQINQQTGAVNDPWVITDELEKLFEVRLVHTDTVEIEDDIDVLMLVHPKDTQTRKPELPDATLYAIDQFVMRKGKGIFFVDPFSNVEFLPMPAGQPLQDANAKSSSLNPLFKKWGFEVDARNIIGDDKLALHTRNQHGQNMRNLSVISATKDYLDSKDPVLASLQSINFAMASYIKTLPNKDPSVEIIPMVETSEFASPIALNRFRFLSDPGMLQQGFNPTGKKYPLVARIRGPLPSAYAEPPKSDESDTAPVELKNPHLTKTQGTADLIVVADTDILSDQLWAQAQSFFGKRIVRPFASNGDFVGNSIENLMGSDDLIGVRSRVNYSRTFTLIDEIERVANQKYRETAKQLQQELDQIEQRLQKLQQQRSDKQKALLTQEQLNELNHATAKRAQVRKQLRHVLHQQNEDIEGIGTRLKIINIGGVPILVALIALVVGFTRLRSRRRSNTG